jgi:N-acetylneuraminic acid mutarotase
MPRSTIFSVLIFHVCGLIGSGNVLNALSKETHSREIPKEKGDIINSVYETWTKLNRWADSKPSGSGEASHLHILGKDGKGSDGMVVIADAFEELALPNSYRTWIYNPSTNSWRSSVRGPTVHGHAMVTMCNETIFLFGGVEVTVYNYSSKSSNFSVVNQTWMFEVQNESWSEIEAEIQDGIIEPRAYHSVVSVRQQLSHNNCKCKESMLVFGGGHIYKPTLQISINESLLYNDLWELRCVETGYRWLSLKTDDGPSRRYSSAATSFNDVMYMFGGCSAGGLFGCKPKDDLWTFNISSNRWRRLLESAPFPSQGLHRLLFMDRSSYRSSNRIRGLFLCCTKPFYFFSLETRQWKEMNFIGTDEEDYKDLVEAYVAEICGDVYIFGGFDYPRLLLQEELWKATMLETDTLLLTKKSQDSSPPIRGTQVAVVDRRSNRLMAHGGISYITMFYGADYSERNTGVWLFDIEKRTYSVHRPSRRLSLIGHVGALLSYPDTVLVVFGGFSSRNYEITPENSTWGFFIDENAWVMYQTIESHPQGRRSASATAITGHSLIMFGGVTEMHEILNDTWVFTLTGDIHVGKWERIDPQESPQRFGHTLVLVSNKDVLLYGGSMKNKSNSLGTVTCSDQLWHFDTSRQQWKRIIYHGSGPGPRCFHSATGSGEKMIVAGGCKWLKDTRLDGLYLYDIQLHLCQSSENSPSVWHYSVGKKRWSKMESLPLINHVFIEGKLLLLGEQNIVAFGGYSVPTPQTYDYENLYDQYDWYEWYNWIDKYRSGIWALTVGCPAGTKAQRFWDDICETCPQGYFSEFNAVRCERCPPGFTTSKSQSTTEKNCSLCDETLHFCDQGVCYVPEEIISRGVFDRKCRCNDGYTHDHSGKCSVPTAYLAGVGGFVTVAFVCCAVILYIRHTKAKRAERRCQQVELAAMNQVWRINASEIIMKERIDGDTPGGFGEVYKAEYREMTVAIKKLHSIHTGIGRYQQEFDREIKVMRTIRHPNIVLFFGGGHFESNEDGSRSPFLVVEYMSRGCLGAILRDKYMPLDDRQKLKFALDTAEGMAFLHSLRPPRVHRDLKSFNLLVSDRWTVKVADFGAARLVKQEGMCQAASRDKDVTMSTPLLNADALLSTDCGSLLWCAPELLERKDYGTPVDVYSFGIVLWEIWERRLPYDDHDSGFSYQIETLVCQGTRPTIPKHNEWPSDVISLMCTCWCHHPHKRPTFDSVVEKLKEMKDNL